MNSLFKKYFAGIILALSLLTGLWTFIFYFQLGVATESSRWTYAWSVLKNRTAHQISGKKLIVIAGSNALYGVDSNQIERELKIPSVNLAINMNLNLPYILEQAKRVAKQGDIILLPLEYEHYEYDGGLKFEFVDFIAAHDLDYFSQLSTWNKIRTIFAMPERRLYEGIKNRFYPIPSSFMLEEDISKLDPKGNQRETEVSKVNSYQHDIVEETKFRPFKLKENAKSWKILEDFIQWCQNNQITLLATFPSLMNFKEYNQDSQKKFFDYLVRFYQKRGVKTIGTPEEFRFPRSFFFDSRYHLISDARKIRTEKIIQHIQKEGGI